MFITNYEKKLIGQHLGAIAANLKSLTATSGDLLKLDVAQTKNMEIVTSLLTDLVTKVNELDNRLTRLENTKKLDRAYE